ncbi:hypothetical protein JOC24_006571 [Streptomyces sp. HB132]|nr:hypothetical protein [Streptomyces sp. HB132]
MAFTVGAGLVDALAAGGDWDHHALWTAQQVGLPVLRRQQQHPRRLTPAITRRDLPHPRTCPPACTTQIAHPPGALRRAPREHCSDCAPGRVPDPRRRKDTSRAQAAGAPPASGPADKAPGFEPAQLVGDRSGGASPTRAPISRTVGASPCSVIQSWITRRIAACRSNRAPGRLMPSSPRAARGGGRGASAPPGPRGHGRPSGVDQNGCHWIRTDNPSRRRRSAVVWRGRGAASSR